MRWTKWQFGVFVLCIITMLLTGCITKNPEYETGYEKGYLDGSIDLSDVSQIKANHPKDVTERIMECVKDMESFIKKYPSLRQ